MNPSLLLIIDDDPDDREIFVAAIKEIAPNIICKTSGDPERVLLTTKEEDKPDLIFLDINMPGMNGFQFLAEANRHHILAHTKVVIYSTSSNPKDIETAKLLGAHAFITKTNTYPELCRELRKYLSHYNS